MTMMRLVLITAIRCCRILFLYLISSDITLCQSVFSPWLAAMGAAAAWCWNVLLASAPILLLLLLFQPWQATVIAAAAASTTPLSEVNPSQLYACIPICGMTLLSVRSHYWNNGETQRLSRLFSKCTEPRVTHTRDLYCGWIALMAYLHINKCMDLTVFEFAILTI